VGNKMTVPGLIPDAPKGILTVVGDEVNIMDLIHARESQLNDTELGDRIAALVRHGTPTSEVAKKLDVDENTVWRFLRNMKGGADALNEGRIVRAGIQHNKVQGMVDQALTTLLDVATDGEQERETRIKAADRIIKLSGQFPESDPKKGGPPVSVHLDLRGAGESRPMSDFESRMLEVLDKEKAIEDSRRPPLILEVDDEG